MAVPGLLNQPQVGPDLTFCIIYGLTISGGGVPTKTASATIGVLPTNLENVVRHVNFTNSPGHQEINAMNRRPRNQVVIDEGSTLSLQIFKVNNGNDPNPLITLWASYDYFLVQWVEGTQTGAIYTNSFYGCRGELDNPFEGRGEQLCTANFVEPDFGVPQFSRVLTG